MSTFRIALAAGLLTIGASAASASTLSYGFGNIPSTTATAGDALAPNFTLDVTDAGGGLVQFTVSSMDIPSSQAFGTDDFFIGSIYFEDQSNPQILSAAPTTSIGGSGYTAFSEGNGNGNLPQGNNVGFQSTYDYTRDTGNPPGPGNPNAANGAGVQQGESVSFFFTGDYATVTAGLASGSLRVGLHVQAIGTGDASDSYVSVAPVPLPAAGLLLLGGMGGLAALRRRRRTT